MIIGLDKYQLAHQIILTTCDNASEIISIINNGSDGSNIQCNKIWYVGTCGSGQEFNNTLLILQ